MLAGSAAAMYYSWRGNVPRAVVLCAFAGLATTQLLVQGIEVAKAYNELNDPLEQEARFKEEEAKKGRGSEEAMAADLEFVEALKHGLPPTAGFGMGIDRLTAILTGSHSVKEVILFPTMRPGSPEEVK